VATPSVRKKKGTNFRFHMGPEIAKNALGTQYGKSPSNPRTSFEKSRAAKANDAHLPISGTWQEIMVGFLFDFFPLRRSPFFD